MQSIGLCLPSWFQTFAVFSILYAFFWVIPRCLNFMCVCVCVRERERERERERDLKHNNLTSTVPWLTPTHAHSPSHTYPWPQCGSLPSTAYFCTWTRPYPHIEDGWRRFAFLHYNCARRMMQICVFNTRLFSLHYTLNYAIHRTCLQMVLLTDVYRNLTSLWIKF